jgi:hypothetical protein
LFGQRMAAQSGAPHILLQQYFEGVPTDTASNGPGVAWVAPEREVDAEDAVLRAGPRLLVSPEGPAKYPKVLVVRVLLKGEAIMDKRETHFRTGPAAVRLVVPTGDGTARNYYPIGTLAQGRYLYVNRPDDFIVAEPGNGIDFAFDLKLEDVCVGNSAKEPILREGTFIEVKRLAREDLAGRRVVLGTKANPKVAVLVKGGPAVPVFTRGGTPVASSGTGSEPPKPVTPEIPTATNSGVRVLSFQDSTDLPGRIQVPKLEDSELLNLGSGSAAIKSQRFTMVDLATPVSLVAHDRSIAGFRPVIAGKPARMLQAIVQPDAKDPWAWSKHISGFTLNLDSNTTLNPVGFWVVFDESAGKRIIIRYNPDQPALQLDTAGLPAPSQVGLLYVLDGSLKSQAKSLGYDGRLVPSN